MTMIITIALYGLKTSANAGRDFFGKSLKDMGYALWFTNLDN